MQEKYWKTSELKSYTRFILKRNIRIIREIPKHWPREVLKFAAIAVPSQDLIYFSKKKFTRVLIWHECGHVAVYNKGQKVGAIDEEYYAQMWAIMETLSRGYVNVFNDMMNYTNTWQKFKETRYRDARKRILNDIGKYF